MDVLLQLDGNILLWIQEHVRNAVLTPVMTFITHLGDAGYSLPTAAVEVKMEQAVRGTRLFDGDDSRIVRQAVREFFRLRCLLF